MRKRKKRKTFEAMGKQRYDFDIQRELVCYEALCYYRLRKKKLKKLEDCLKFNSYMEWKNYIIKRYEAYDREKMTEFSRYLNRAIRDNEPDWEYWNLMTTVCVTFFFTKYFDCFFDMKPNGILFWVIGFIPLGIGLLCFFFFPLFDNNIKKNFLIDYKEIIDEMIEKKDECNSDRNISGFDKKMEPCNTTHYRR